MTELLPCPFCGGKAAFAPRAVNLALQKDPSTPKFGVSVICGRCGCESANMVDGAHAAAKWNTRAATPAQSDWELVGHFVMYESGGLQKMAPAHANDPDAVPLYRVMLAAAGLPPVEAAAAKPSVTDAMIDAAGRARYGLLWHGDEDRQWDAIKHMLEVALAAGLPPSPQPSPATVTQHGIPMPVVVWERIKDGIPADCTEEEYRAYAAVQLAREKAARAAPEPSIAALEGALDLLDILFTAYEEGPACYEDPDEHSGYLGQAVKLDHDTFHACADLLNRLRPRAAAHGMTSSEPDGGELPAVPSTVPAGQVVAWMWQNEETGRVGFIDQWQIENGWQASNPRLRLIRPLVFVDQTRAPDPHTGDEQC